MKLSLKAAQVRPEAVKDKALRTKEILRRCACLKNGLYSIG
jgi:hypothetical protein